MEEIESKAYQNFMFKIDTLFKAFTKPIKEEYKWMSVEDVVNYTGFSKTWVVVLKYKIGCFEDGKDLRFKKANIDKYMESNSFKLK